MRARGGIVPLVLGAALLGGGLGLASAAAAQDAALAEGEQLNLHSAVLDEERVLSVLLPADYAESGRRYPVLVTLDGEMTWRFALVAATTRILAGDGRMPDVILVGVHNTDRTRDMFPVTLGSGRGGGADRFLQFLAEELLPWLDEHYRTAPCRILCGYSNSGLFAVYALLERPELFQAVIAASPMLGWCPELIAGRARDHLARDGRPAGFLRVVYGDGDYERVTEHVPAFFALLDELGPADLRRSRRVLAGERHVPLGSVADGLTELFRDWALADEEIVAGGLDGLQAHHETLARTYGFAVPVPVESLVHLAYDHLQHERHGEALAVLAYGADIHPRAARLPYFAGVVHRRAGDRERAAASFARALELDPGNRRAAQALAELRTEAAGDDGLVVSVDWLLRHGHEADLIVVDARGADAHARGHIPGAVSLPADGPAGPGGLGPALGRLGLLPRHRLVVHGAPGTLPAAAHTVWRLAAVGARRVHLLDGDLEAWRDAGGTLTAEPTTRRALAWPAAPDAGVAIDAAELSDRLGQPGLVILDARGAGCGTTAAAMDAADGAWREGHLPGALPVDFAAWLSGDGAVPPAAELGARLAEVGPRPGTPVDPGAEFVVHDTGDGEDAALGWLLLRAAGCAPVRRYAGGWEDWRGRPELPRVRIVGARELRDRLRAGSTGHDGNAESSGPLPDRPPRTFVLLDVRHPAAHAREHLPGAVSLLSTQVADSLSAVLARCWPGLDPARTTAVVYCWGPACIRSRTAAGELVRHGFRRVEWFRGGLQAWHELGEPVCGEPAPPRLRPPERRPPGR